MTRAPALDEKVVLLDGALQAADVPHAFGGALALAYYAEPRATRDVDVNVFVPANAAATVIDALTALGVRADRRRALPEIRRDGQTRLAWGANPVDLFFSYDPFHDACRAGVRVVPFGEVDIPILGPEHLVVCKAVFDRRKDWLDIEQVLFVLAGELDLGEVRHWVHAIVGPADPRLGRLESAITAVLG